MSAGDRVFGNTLRHLKYRFFLWVGLHHCRAVLLTLLQIVMIPSRTHIHHYNTKQYLAFGSDTTEMQRHQAQNCSALAEEKGILPLLNCGTPYYRISLVCALKCDER